MKDILEKPVQKKSENAFEAHARAKNDRTFTVTLNDGKLSYLYSRKGNIIQITRQGSLNPKKQGR